MQDPYILQMTASDPMSLQDVINMRNEWENDAMKLIFIILSKYDKTINNSLINHMIGDINLFISDIDHVKNAEINIMIAEEGYRGQGYAKEALLLTIDYGIKSLSIQRYFVKISSFNHSSIQLFKRYV